MCGMAPLLARGVLPSLYKNQALQPGWMRASSFMNHLEKILLLEVTYDLFKVKNIFACNMFAFDHKIGQANRYPCYD